MRAYVIFLLVPVSLASYGGFLYYRLAWLHHQSRRALRHVDEQLNNHHELIPHLILALAEYAHHEKLVFENLIHARKLAMSASNLEERILASMRLSHALHHFLRVSESKTQLSADDHATLLHMKVVLSEQKIALAREYYNEVVGHYNHRISSFPSNVMAKIVGFERKVLFEIPDNMSYQLAPV